MENRINIRPGVRMLELFASLPYKEWYAIGELVDNAIQSWAANRATLEALHGEDFSLEIDVWIDRDGDGRIEVSDNAAGISEHDWERALRVAVPPDDTGGLSQFGVGLKAAACWFSKQWEVRSTALGEPVERTVAINVPETVTSEIEEVSVMDRGAAADSHGTTVTMTELRRRPRGRTVGKIKDHLASIYRDFLRTGQVCIRYNGEEITFKEVPILVASSWDDPDGPAIEWKKEFSFRLESGKSVRGWAAIRQTGKQKEAGLALLYRGKVIVGAGDDPYKPEKIFLQGNSFEAQRIFGEVDVSEFEVSHTKDSLVWSDEEDEVVELLYEALTSAPVPIIQQARHYRARRPDPLPTRDLDEIAERVARDLATVRPLLQTDSQSRTARRLDYLEESGIDHERRLTVDVEGRATSVTMRILREPGMEWLRVIAAPNDEALRIDINRSHPFMRIYCEAPVQELEPVWRIAMAVALGLTQGRFQGATKPALILKGINDQLQRLAYDAEE